MSVKSGHWLYTYRYRGINIWNLKEILHHEGKGKGGYAKKVSSFCI